MSKTPSGIWYWSRTEDALMLEDQKLLKKELQALRSKPKAQEGL